MARKRKRKEKNFTTSKQILWVSILLFAVTVFLAIRFSNEGKDTSIFSFILPITGGIAGATIVFYLNKSKMENVFRFKISFLEYKLKLLKKHQNNACVVEEEISSIENALDSKVDSTMQEAVNEDISIQNY